MCIPTFAIYYISLTEASYLTLSLCFSSYWHLLWVRSLYFLISNTFPSYSERCFVNKILY